MKSGDLMKALFGFPPDYEIEGGEDGELYVYEPGAFVKGGRCLATLGTDKSGLCVTYYYGAQRMTCRNPLPDRLLRPYHWQINRRCKRGLGHSGACDDN